MVIFMTMMELVEKKNIHSFGLTVNYDRERDAEVKIIIAEDMPFVSIEDMIEDEI
jgi:hypothetical protein